MLHYVLARAVAQREVAAQARETEAALEALRATGLARISTANDLYRVAQHLSTSAARAAASAARRRRAGRAPRAHVVRLRIKPSCVVEATSLPSCVNTRPRARPRPPCAAGLSRA